MLINTSISLSGHHIAQHNHSMVPQLYGFKAVTDRVHINDNGVQVIQTRVPAVLILFGYLVGLQNVTLTKEKANYNDDCNDFSHSGAVLSEQVSNGIAKVEIELSEPGEYYVCFQQHNVDGQNQSKVHKAWLHQGSNYHVTLKVCDRLMPIPLQISLILLCLVLSGTFSGLNLGLMSLDLNEIQVIIRCGTESEKQYAKIIAPIRRKGNYLLCSILFGNVLVNSTLTILMDDLSSGLIAVIVSTLSIVIFGEIVPQAICSRHGLAVGAKTIYLTKLFMLLTFPLSLLISKILDRVLGEEMGHVYDRERLMEYIRITKTYNQLEDDEMNIISGALCLKTKDAEDVMTRLEDAFMLPITATLDFNTVSEISNKGYSRIPVYDSERKNIVGLLHSKDLTFIDPDDKKPLKTIIEFYRHPLIHTDADERLNNVLNHFKCGKSHLAFVRKLIDTGEGDPYYEIVGLVTLEDVIEEILQMEIVDETDILTDNRRKQRRKETQNRQDFTDFARIGEGEIGTHLISPQMGLCIFQYLSTAIEPFKYITESILRRLIAQKIYYIVEKDEIEERTYLTTYSLGSMVNEDSPKLLYKFGKPADYFIMILEGKVKVVVGSEKLTFEAGPFTYFGVSALNPPALVTKILLAGNSITNNSSAPLNGLNTNSSQTNQPHILHTATEQQPIAPESTPLLENQLSYPTSCSRSGSPEMNSESYNQTQHLDGHSFVPDFTVKPLENTLYMKIPRKVYLAAFRASLMDRKDEFLESDMMRFKEEVDNIFYNLEANKTIGTNNQTLSKIAKRPPSEIIKEKKFSITSFPPQLKFMPLDTATFTATNPKSTCKQLTSPSSTIKTATNQITQNPVAHSLNKQRRPSLIDGNNKVQSPKTIKKLLKHHTVPSSTNLSTLNANNNSYTTVNNNLANMPLTNQLENVVIVDGKDVKKSPF